MSRLADSYRKMGELPLDPKRQQEIDDFREFYKTAYYPIFKEDLRNQLDQLNRATITDPQSLITVQGTRNALIGVLDKLDKMERRISDRIINDRAE
jgi:hypothetical protein